MTLNEILILICYTVLCAINIAHNIVLFIGYTEERCNVQKSAFLDISMWFGSAIFSNLLIVSSVIFFRYDLVQ